MRRILLPLPALALLLPAAPAPARTWLVVPGGGGDAPSIAAALALAAPGDVVELAPGLHAEAGLVLPEGVTLRGLGADPSGATVDAAGSGRILSATGVSSATRVENLTLANGRVAGACEEDPGTGTYCMGGAALLVSAAPVFSRVVFRDGFAEDNGGAVASVASAPRFEDCAFVGNGATHGGAVTFVTSAAGGDDPVLLRCRFESNTAAADGGALYAYLARPRLDRCTFRRNSCGQQGSAMFWHEPAPPAIERTLVADGTGGDAVACNVGAPAPVFLCSDLWGNEGGDWTGCLAGQGATGGNFSADPLFCAPEGAGVDAASPCAPSGPCGAVGAGDVACAVSGTGRGVAAESWGRAKARWIDARR